MTYREQDREINGLIDVLGTRTPSAALQTIETLPDPGSVPEIVVLRKFRGQPLSHAATVAAVAALGGLITWAIYHAISRRDDGMAIFVLALGALNGQNSLSVRAAVVAQIASGLAALDGKGDETNIIAPAVSRLEVLSSSRSCDLLLPSPFSASDRCVNAHRPPWGASAWIRSPPMPRRPWGPCTRPRSCWLL